MGGWGFGKEKRVRVLMLYFAYGSNMNFDRMRERNVAFALAQSGSLLHHRLAFNKSSTEISGISYANIVREVDGVVEGVLYQLSDEQQIFKLDVFEGVPYLYSRDKFWIETGGDRVAAWVYIANAALVKEGLKPARWYLQHLLAGKDYLSSDYYHMLENTEVAP